MAKVFLKSKNLVQYWHQADIGIATQSYRKRSIMSQSGIGAMA
jgi:hypothetical protein